MQSSSQHEYFLVIVADIYFMQTFSMLLQEYSEEMLSACGVNWFCSASLSKAFCFILTLGELFLLETEWFPRLCVCKPLW